MIIFLNLMESNKKCLKIIYVLENIMAVSDCMYVRIPTYVPTHADCKYFFSVTSNPSNVGSASPVHPANTTLLGLKSRYIGPYLCTHIKMNTEHFIN